MSHQHDWSRWIRGRRTALWFRHCLTCAACEQSQERPEDAEAVRGMPDVYVDSDTYSEAEIEVTGTPERFNQFRVRAALRSHIIDFRAKRAGA